MKLADQIFRRSDWHVTSPFGMRMHPIDKVLKMHNGTDYSTGGQKWPQYALEDGIVVSAGRDNTGAIYAWVRYPRLGIEVQHYHLDRVFFRAGQKVTKNTVIGNTGATGKATGIHMHMSLRKAGMTERLDPHAYDYTPMPQNAYERTPVPQSLDTLAKEVILGKWGVGEDRKKRLAAAGYDYAKTQAKVNEMLKKVKD